MTTRTGRSAWIRIGLASACASLVLAAWAPQLRLPAARFDGVIVLDITQSMNAEDYVVDGRPTSRLAVAKAATRRALEALPCGSRVGWGVFTEHRTLVLIAPAEVCANFGELAAVLDAIDGRVAWAGASEVAKGIHSAVREAKALRERPAIVFVTDGHEAPPLHPAYRPRFGGRPGEVAGLIVGAGGPAPVPIPKFDLDGRRLGYWSADDVAQSDSYSGGREGSSVAGERYAETEAFNPPPGWPAGGNEHLSQLRESYLRLLGDELEFQYLRLDSVSDGARALAERMQAPPLARVAPTSVSLRPVFGWLGLLAIVCAYGAPLFGKRGQPRSETLRPSGVSVRAAGSARCRPGPARSGRRASRPSRARSAPSSSTRSSTR
jgi:mxaL protein